MTSIMLHGSSGWWRELSVASRCLHVCAFDV